MTRNEFRLYMNNQIYEIRKYQENMAKINPNFDPNILALEWVEKYAKSYGESRSVK
ncbi:MAG: hypothetical protein KA885_08445 [Spirochaetes bacterium]|nr:hypothetical protein [Spirochaetota bacterium]